MSLDQLRNEEAGNSLIIRRLRDQYNLVMEQLEREVVASAIDPLARLPPEISSRCIGISLPGCGYAQRLLELTTVSKRWQQLLIYTPLLWKYVDIRASQHDTMATLAIFLKLSDTSLIYLTIWNDPGEEWDDILSLLSLHQQRICSIETRQERKQTPGLRFSILGRCLRSLRLLPASVQVHCRDHPLELNPRQLEEFGNYPNGLVLKNLDVGLSSVPADSNTLSLLGGLTTSDALGELGPKFPSMNNLSSICFVPPSGIGDSPPSPFICAPPHLSSLIYHQNFDHSLLLLIKSAVNTLQILDVSIPSSKWRELLNCSISAINLRELRINLERSATGENNTTPFIPLTSIRALKSLHLTGNWWSGRREAHNYGDLTFEEVFEACAVLYPSIGSFTLDYFDFDSDYLPLRMYLEHLEWLQCLRIRGRTPNWEVNITPILLQSLRRLDAQCTLLPYIEAPKLEWFTVPGGEELETTRFASVLGIHIWFDAGDFQDFQITVNDRNYPALSHITLELPLRSEWYMPHLHLLRSVTIKSKNPLDQNATAFCLHILYSPDICPQLEEVELTGFVEWDILMLMLERRNFIRDGVKRINTLRLPLKPSFLEIPLALLLSGKYAERPSNKDLSTESVKEALCSPEVYVTSCSTLHSKRPSVQGASIASKT
jgi:hypothetical protein